MTLAEADTGYRASFGQATNTATIAWTTFAGFVRRFRMDFNKQCTHYGDKNRGDYCSGFGNLRKIVLYIGLPSFC